MANIVVVDDEPLLLGLIASVLRQAGYKVTALLDPQQAIDNFTKGGSPIDLLVTDVSMNPISGFQLMQRLSLAGFDAPVLFTSGYPAMIDAIAKSLGNRAIIEKPFTAPQLRLAVSQALKRARKPLVA
jgi:CheY-like chemotaxis protein